MAGAMRRRGFDAEEIYAALSKHNQKYCSPPLADDEVKIISKSVSRYTPAELRTCVQLLERVHRLTLEARRLEDQVQALQGALAHDLDLPVLAVAQVAERLTLEDTPPALRPEIEGLSAAAQCARSRLSALHDQSGLVALRPRPTQSRATPLRAVVDAAMATAGGPTTAVRWRQGEVDPVVVTDPGLLQQALEVLLAETRRRTADVGVVEVDTPLESPGAIELRGLCDEVVRELTAHKYTDVKYTKHAGVGEVISEHYDIRVGDEVIAFLYKPLACHSYNTIRINSDGDSRGGRGGRGESIRIATIDTMLSFYLAFIYADRVYYDINRILCMSQFLFDVQQHNRLKQTGLLRRFSINCYGKQPTLESMRFEKTAKYEELKGKRESREFEEWFLRYVPYENTSLRKNKIAKKTRRRNKKNE
jgi:hypothetical protein